MPTLSTEFLVVLTIKWDTSANAGFSKATPWMRVHDDYAEGWNVEQQTKDPKSTFAFWQKMLKTRKQYESLIYGKSSIYYGCGSCAKGTGKFVPLDVKNEEVYAWIRDDPTINQKVLIVLNFARGADKRGKEVTWSIPSEVDVSNAKLIITNGEAKEGEGLSGREIALGKWEGRIYLL